MAVAAPANDVNVEMLLVVKEGGNLRAEGKHMEEATEK